MYVIWVHAYNIAGQLIRCMYDMYTYCKDTYLEQIRLLQ